MYPRKLVGWSMRETLHTQIALEALAMALARQWPEPGLIHHSDRGIQSAAEAYRGGALSCERFVMTPQSPLQRG